MEAEIAATSLTDASARPRVLVVTHLFPSEHAPLRGPWVAEQVDALTAYAEIEVLCATPGAAERSMVRDSGVRVTYTNTATALGSGRAGLLGSTILSARTLRRHLKANEGRYDLLHAHFGFPDAFVASREADREGLPLVVTLHGDDALHVAPRRDLIGRVVREGLQGADIVICVSEGMAGVVRPLLPEADVRTAPNGFDEALFRVAEVERDLGILFVGLLVPVKNVDVLMRAYARVRERLSVPLTIAGDGPLLSDLRALAGTLGIAEFVRFPGRLKRAETAAYMQRARVLALPSSSEGFPLVLGEALACGTPVVASDVGGVPEIVTSRHVGTLVPSGDSNALASALIDWCTGTVDPHVVSTSSPVKPWPKAVLPVAHAYRDACLQRHGL